MVLESTSLVQQNPELFFFFAFLKCELKYISIFPKQFCQTTYWKLHIYPNKLHEIILVQEVFNS